MSTLGDVAALAGAGLCGLLQQNVGGVRAGIGIRHSHGREACPFSVFQGSVWTGALLSVRQLLPSKSIVQ